MKIVENSALYQDDGYNECDIEKNGELEILQNEIIDNNVIFDAGANVGDWSRLVLQYHPTTKLHLFEPLPSCYQILSKDKKLTSSKINNIAISSITGATDIYYYPSISVLSSIYRRSPEIETKYNLHPIKTNIQTKTIEQYCEENNIDVIDFLKIDTEGSEVDVLHGALSLIQKRKIKKIQFEYGGCFLDAGKTLLEIFLLLTNNNYNIYRITKKYLIHISKYEDNLENYKYSNYFAVCK